jgi:hypothetical protein
MTYVVILLLNNCFCTQDKLMERGSGPPIMENAELQEIAQLQYDMETCMRRSMGSQELVVAQMGAETLPEGLGDTLSLQLAPLKKIQCPRNKMTSMISRSSLSMVSLHWFV